MMSATRNRALIVQHGIRLQAEIDEASSHLDKVGITRSHAGCNDPDCHTLLGHRVKLLCGQVAELRQALAYYTAATVVSDWGMQELAPDWMVAREALGLPDLFGSERDAALGEVRYFDDGNYNEDA